MAGILSQIPEFKVEELRKEKELELLRVSYFDRGFNPLKSGGGLYKDVILKFGLPQGTSLSPLLAISVIDEAIKKVG